MFPKWKTGVELPAHFHMLDVIKKQQDVKSTFFTTGQWNE